METINYTINSDITEISEKEKEVTQQETVKCVEYGESEENQRPKDHVGKSRHNFKKDKGKR